MEINNLWGKILVEEKFKDVIKSKEFKSLKSKNQLGFNKDALHTRYDHSIGVYYLAKKLIAICKKKFSHILDITIEDEESILLMALVHDIGHGGYSHVIERILTGTHEERTLQILKDEASEIHIAIVNNFSKEILEKVINIIVSQKNIKDNENSESSNGLSFILGKLLSGGIDIDRLDYIARDSKELSNESNDYTGILESIDIECIDDNLEIVFDESAEYMISNFFNKRFEMYDNHYVEKNIVTLEKMYCEYIKYIKLNLNWNTSQIELENLFLRDITNKNPIIARFAKLLHYKELDDKVLVNEFSDELSANNFKNKIRSFVPEINDLDLAVIEEIRVISIYSPKNKIYLKTNGIISDIKDKSKILNSNLSKTKYIYSIDLEMVLILLKQKKYDDKSIKEIIKKIIKCTIPEIEQEKKYEFHGNADKDKIEECIREIKKSLNLHDQKNDINEDKYYDDENGTLEKNKINLRKRIVDGKEEINLKSPIEDSSSITKRKEIPFTTIENAKKYIKENYGILLGNVKETISIVTFREKYIVEFYGGIYEFVFDRSKYSYFDEENKGEFIMIECEHKKGSTVGLYFINQLLNEFDILFESRNSKLSIAKSNLNKKNTRVRTNIK